LLKLGFPQVVNWKFLSTSSHSWDDCKNTKRLMDGDTDGKRRHNLIGPIDFLFAIYWHCLCRRC
jgi:hypothetical protein